ncbi:DUF4174 domain-containing protein [Candidatus Poribacteria bacterium]|nr:DUF4174 domain-containing protein [Candidatus Poribacteria bacterium]
MQIVKLILFCIPILLVSSTMAYAHRPVIIKDQSSKDNPVLVKEPEISYAYYGQLVGEAHYYKIVYPKEFVLYVNILVPDFYPKAEAIAKHDMSFQILTEEKILSMANGRESEWRRFYEPFGRDHYYMGPEFEKRVSAGTYHIKVFNSNNTGKYALAIGKKESFTPWELVGAMLKARSLDKWFFKPDDGGNIVKARKKTLFDFSKADEGGNWSIVNDDVMGGISQSDMIVTNESIAIFQGTLSLENYGGFASVRTKPANFELSGYDGIAIRVKGDGRKYQLRLRTDDRLDGVSYQQEFQTMANKWTNIKLPFDEFVPTFRGRIVADAPDLSPGKIRQIGFLIADKKPGSFRLEIDWMEAYMEGKDVLDLSDYKWKNRLLLVFSPSETYPDYRLQKRELEEQMAEVEDRDLIVFTVFEKGGNSIGASPMTDEEGEFLREKYGIELGQFTIILVGKDGEEKLRRTEHTPLEEIFSVVDAMPMRQAEMRERGE